jgi:O-antigen ligase
VSVAQWVLAALCCAALSMSSSVTSTMSLICAVVAMVLQGRAGNRACVVFITTALALGLLAPVLASHFGEVALLFGRESDFSGRTQVWMFSLEFLQRSPLLGYGYTAFWGGPAAIIFQRWAGFPVPNAHNGYLDLALGVGIPGAALVIVVVGRLIWMLARPDGGEEAVRSRRFTAALLTFVLVMNITENRLFTGNEIITLLFVYLVVRANAPARETVAEADMSANISADTQPAGIDMHARMPQ